LPTAASSCRPVRLADQSEGVTLHDTDVIYGLYREKMIEAQRKHLDFFKERMSWLVASTRSFWSAIWARP
jgi:hypothetical protein